MWPALGEVASHAFAPTAGIVNGARDSVEGGQNSAVVNPPVDAGRFSPVADGDQSLGKRHLTGPDKQDRSESITRQ
jgi:hypothetical protein